MTRYAIMFMLEDYPTYFHIEVPLGAHMDLRIQELATLIVPNPGVVMSSKDRGGFLNTELTVLSQEEEVLEWLDSVLSDKPRDTTVNMKAKTHVDKFSTGRDPFTLIRSTEVCRETGIHSCPVCSAGVELYSHKRESGDSFEWVVMCSRSENFDPQSDLMKETGCLLYLPPKDFYNATESEAINYWNDWHKAVKDLRSASKIERLPSDSMQRVESYMSINSPLTLRRLKGSVDKLREMGDGSEPEPEQYFSAVVGMAMLNAYVAGMDDKSHEKPSDTATIVSELCAII